MTLTSVADGADPFVETPESLAETSVGDEVLVEEIISDLVRTLCADGGIRVGDRLRVQYSQADTVIVRNVKGRLVRLHSPYALFVRISHFFQERTRALPPSPSSESGQFRT